MNDDSRWRGTEHPRLGAMWGPIPVELLYAIAVFGMWMHMLFCVMSD